MSRDRVIGRMGSWVKRLGVRSDRPPLTEVLDTGRRATFVPPGHFYSPIADVDDLSARRDAVWPAVPKALGIDFNDESHRHVLGELFPKFMGDYDYPEHEGTDPAAFYTQNSQFSWLDARALFVLLRAWQPRRVIEVGSGFSSLLIADVNRRWLEGRVEFTCIEPYPRPFLRSARGVTRLIEQTVQSIPLTVFETLGEGDILFIDSSHVSKTGSDVNFLYFEVLPRLAAGVHVHVHDIFLPNDYPQDWVLGQNRSWNEQYVLRALLMYSSMFRVTFGCSYAFHTEPALVKTALAHPKGHAFAGGSFWMTKVA